MRNAILLTGILAVFGVGCASIEYSVVIVGASQAVASAEVAGAGCTQDQLDALSPETRNEAPEAGTELASSDDDSYRARVGEPMCYAPFEYYAALEYLRKAREEVGYSDYEAAMESARQSRTYARKATEIAIHRQREGGR